MFEHISTIEYLESTFPHLAEELHDEAWCELLHLQMAVFARWAQEVITEGDERTWEQITTAFLTLWRDCDSDVANALNVSFLEILTFADGKKRRRSWAYNSMPVEMQKAWDDMEQYNRKLHGG